MSDLDAAIDTLYALPLDGFTAGRDSLAKKLKEDGDKEAAKTIKALKKPSVPAWTVNQLARQQTTVTNELLEVQEQLGDADSRKQVRELSQRRKELVAQLMNASEEILESAGHSAGSETLQKISRTLLAGTAGDDAELVRSGRLVRDLTASGFAQAFGFDPAEDGAEDDPVDERSRRKAQELTIEADSEERQAVEQERVAEELRSQLAEAENAATAARRRADKARAKADAAWEKLD